MPAFAVVSFNYKSFAALSSTKDRKPWGNSTLDYLSGKSPLFKI
jgi:hypothetical protein